MADSINTGGGGSARDVTAGADFVGRDSYTFNIENVDDAQLLRVMYRRLFGSDLHGVKGITAEIQEINSRLAIMQKQEDIEQKNLEKKIERISKKVSYIILCLIVLLIPIAYLLMDKWTGG